MPLPFKPGCMLDPNATYTGTIPVRATIQLTRSVVHVVLI